MKKLSELTTEDLKKVWEVNEKLQVEVNEDYQESQMIWISDLLGGIKGALKDWSIGFYQRNYIDIKDDFLFLDALQSADKDSIIFLDEDRERLNKAIEEYNNSYEEDEDIIKLESESEYFQEKTLEYFDLVTNIDFDYIESYFYEFYIDERMNDDFFIDEDFILYENIVKCYK